MSTLSVRLPESLHKGVRELAEREGISINQFIATAVAEKLAAPMAEEYLEERAKRGSRSKYEDEGRPGSSTFGHVRLFCKRRHT